MELVLDSGALQGGLNALVMLGQSQSELVGSM